MKTISLRVPKRLAGILEKRAKELGSSEADLIRSALEEKFDRRVAVSCHDLMQDLCGSAQGPEDLSTNREYLKTLGTLGECS